MMSSQKEKRVLIRSLVAAAVMLLVVIFLVPTIRLLSENVFGAVVLSMSSWVWFLLVAVALAIWVLVRRRKAVTAVAFKRVII